MAGSWISGRGVDIGFSEDVSFEEQSEGRRGLSGGICRKRYSKKKKWWVERPSLVHTWKFWQAAHGRSWSCVPWDARSPRGRAARSSFALGRSKSSVSEREGGRRSSWQSQTTMSLGKRHTQSQTSWVLDQGLPLRIEWAESFNTFSTKPGLWMRCSVRPHPLCDSQR